VGDPPGFLLRYSIVLALSTAGSGPKSSAKCRSFFVSTLATLASMRDRKTLDRRFRALLTEGGAERLE
jgi:hypothetical protein